jgi:hypothetical protein
MMERMTIQTTALIHMAVQNHAKNWKQQLAACHVSKVSASAASSSCTSGQL